MSRRLAARLSVVLAIILYCSVTMASQQSVAVAVAPSRQINVSPSDRAAVVGVKPTLIASAFSDSDTGDTHAASQRQVTPTQENYSSPVFESGTDTTHLTSIIVSPLNHPSTYYWRVSHQDNHGACSDRSAETSPPRGHHCRRWTVQPFSQVAATIPLPLLYKGFKRGFRLKELPFECYPCQEGLSRTRYLKAGLSYALMALKPRLGLQ